jgi:hypothetical protein
LAKPGSEEQRRKERDTKDLRRTKNLVNKFGYGEGSRIRKYQEKEVLGKKNLNCIILKDRRQIGRDGER